MGREQDKTSLRGKSSISKRLEEDLRADGRKISVQCSGIFTDWMRKLGSRQGAKPEKNGLPFGAGCIFGGVAAKSAFALLLTKVTKEGLRPDAARTTNVRAGTDKNRLSHRLAA